MITPGLDSSKREAAASVVVHLVALTMIGSSIPDDPIWLAPLRAFLFVGFAVGLIQVLLLLPRLKAQGSPHVDRPLLMRARPRAGPRD